MDGGKITSQELYSISIFSWLGGRRLLYLPCEIGFVQICFEGYVIRSVESCNFIPLDFRLLNWQTVECLQEFIILSGDIDNDSSR